MRLKGDEPKKVCGQDRLSLCSSLFIPCLFLPTKRWGQATPYPYRRWGQAIPAPQRGGGRRSLIHSSEQVRFSSTQSLLFMETGGCFKSSSNDLHLTCMSL